MRAVATAFPPEMRIILHTNSCIKGVMTVSIEVMHRAVKVMAYSLCWVTWQAFL